MKSDWIKFMPEGHVALNNVMFAPLVINNVVVGLIGLANKNGDFTENDAKTATYFGELAAISLKNSKDIDNWKKAVEEKEQLIKKLQKSLGSIKTLKGLIPICSYCKKIRDDKGFWSQLEEYIAEHSEADLSHGICPDCVKKYYPDLVDDILRDKK